MKPAPKQLAYAGDILRIDLSRIVIGTKEERSLKQMAEGLTKVGLALEQIDEEDLVTGRRRRINHSRNLFWVKNKKGESIDLDSIKQMQIQWIGPVYHSQRAKGHDDLLCILPTALLVKPKIREENIRERLARYGFKVHEEKSKYLGYLYLHVPDPLSKDAIEHREELLQKEKEHLQEVFFEIIPLIVPTAMVPNDTFYGQQWNMSQVNAGGANMTGWDISIGNPAIVICILDEGCDLNHPELQFVNQGINLGTMQPPGSPTGNHGTACAGVAAAAINNGTGVAGMAGGCRILPVAFQTWSDAEVAAGINFATANGANVISMSFGSNGWNHAVIDLAIQNASNNNVIMCAATHNYNSGITYPATNTLVIAVGASDQNDNRKSPTSPDRECWGSDYGNEISVVAPGVRVPTTDRLGNDGYNNNGGGAINWACVNYPQCGDAAGDFFFIFDGTSAATPHVAGLAALLLSINANLTSAQVRNIIEQTADKVGTVPYAVTPGKPNGTWNQEMGYGRINVYRALHSITKSMLKDMKEVFEKHIWQEKNILLEKNLLQEFPPHKIIGKEKDGKEIYENPGDLGFIDPEMYRKILSRLDVLEKEVQGQSFIRKEERPDVSRAVARRAKRRKE
jgi:hypothetical protein